MKSVFESSTPSTTQPTRPKAYSYIRMSTKEQLQGSSLKRQLDLTKAYAEEHGLELVDKYDDIGVSAFRGLNAEYGALKRFRDAAAEGEISPGSFLILESMDRLSRQTAHVAVGILSEIISCDITVVTLDNRLAYSKESIESAPYQLFVVIGEMTRAHEESRRKSGLIAHVWMEKRRKLTESGTPMTSRLPAWLRLNRATNTIESIDSRVEIVREIFELACGGYGTYSIARMFNGRKEPRWGTAKRELPDTLKKIKKPKVDWHDSYIKKILSTRAVLGEFQPHVLELTPNKKQVRVPVGESMKGYYPQIIGEERFREAALAMERRRIGGKGRKGSGYSNIFTGLLHCGQCGASMRYLDKGPSPKGGKYLRCSIAVSGGSCISKSYRYENIEAFILSMLDSLDVQKVLGGPSASRSLAEKRTQRELTRLEIEASEKKVATLNNLLLEDGDAPPTSTLGLIRGLERTLTEQQTKLRSLDDELAELLAIDPVQREAVVRDLLSSIRHTDEPLRTKARRALAAELHRMIEAISIRPDVEFAHEIVDIDPSWQTRYRVDSLSRLERHLEEFGFELSIRYRGGNQQFIRGVNKSRLKMKWSSRFDDLKLLLKHGQ